MHPLLLNVIQAVFTVQLQLLLKKEPTRKDNNHRCLNFPRFIV